MEIENSSKASVIEDDIKFVLGFMERDMSILRELQKAASTELEKQSYQLAISKFNNVRKLLRNAKQNYSRANTRRTSI